MMRKREGTQNESDTKRFCMGDLDVFFVEGTTSLIISYLSEDAKFCFSLTSKKNKRRVDDFIKRDELYKDKTKPLSDTSENDIAWSPPLALRRARILYDTIREGHLDVLKWLALDQKVRVDLVCDNTFEQHPLFKHFGHRQHCNMHELNEITSHKGYYESTFSYGEPLKSIEVAARYGKEDIVKYFDVKELDPYLDEIRQECIDLNYIIGGYRTYDTFRGVKMCGFSVQCIVQVAPLEEVEYLIRSRPEFVESIQLEDLALRGDVKLFNYIESLPRETMYDQTTLLYCALLSGNLKMIERVVENEKDVYASPMTVQELREIYCCNKMLRLGIENFTNCKEMTDDIIEYFVMGRRIDYIEDMLDIADDMMEPHK